MNKQNSLLKTLLVVATLLVGMSSWADETVIYDKAVTDWSSSDVTKTELTTGLWYNSVGTVKNNYLSGMYVTTTEGLRLISRNGGVKTAELSLAHTENSTVTIDAVWNAGAASSDANTPYNIFSYGDFSLTQTVRSGDKYTTKFTINGVTTTIDSNSKVTYRTEGGRENNGNELTIHLKVNTLNGTISEFYILAPDATELVSYSSLTNSNNHFASGANYDVVKMTTYMSGSSAFAWNALKSITVKEETQDIYSYTVNAKSGETILKTITTGSDVANTVIYYHYNQVLNIDGTLYSAAAENSGYKSSFTLDSDNKVVTKNYSQPATPVTNLVFLAEGEDVFTRATGSAADTRCSMGAGGYAGTKTEFVTLPAGTYYLVLSNRCSGNRTGIHKFYKGDEEEPFFSADGNGYNAERRSEAIVLDDETTLYMQGGDGNQFVDWLYIYGSAIAPPALSLDKTSANVNAGDAVSFTATLTQGSPVPTIQWYSCDDTEKTNPEAIDGATSNTYSPSTANPGTYYYYVKAENTLGSAESDVITLTVTGVVATPTFTIASFDYEHDGYTITPVCTTEGATLTYTIGDGEAQPCTSGEPFYAKGGKLVITASKDGWTSASIPESQQYTLNAAPSATSPETLISFNLSSDNGDKNLEHVYKSVTIAGGNNGAIGGIGSGATGKLKLRTNQSGNTLTLNVNEGYKVTKVTVEANSNNSGSGATIGLTSVTVDGGENIVTEPTTFPISSAAAVTYNTGDISAASNIVFTFDNKNITGETNKKNNQIIASIKVWYKTPTELAIDEAIADCKANEPSAEFATYIDGGSYASVRDVYVAHTNWQIAQGSNDLTKLIRNAAVVDGSDWGGAYTNHSEQYTGAPDEYYLDRWNATINTNQTIYGVPAGTYIIKAATRASVGTPGTLYVNDGSSDVAKVNQITNVGNTGGDLGNGWSWSEMTFTLTETKDLLIGFWADCSNENWAGCDDWHMTVLETPVTVGANGYTTFASPFALDLTDENRPEGLKAYKATLTGKTLSFAELNQTVAAGTGLLLLGETEGGTYNIPVVATGDAVETALTGVITPTAKQSSDPGDYYFVMKKAKTAEDALTFAPLSTTKEVTIPAGKAYVTVPSLAFGGSDSRSLGISFDEITGIAEVNGRLDNVRGEIYNLKGQRVAQPAKGLYIMNGKKVIIK